MIFDEYKTYNWIEKIKDKRKEILNAEKHKDIVLLDANSFEFLERVCNTLAVALRMSESEFSKHALNATKDYYAYLKNTKKNISDDKLENLLQNLKVLAVSFRNTAEFSKSNSKIRTSEIHKDKVDAYVAKIENYFLIKRDNKINEDLLELIKQENYLINTNNIKTALNNY